MPLPESLVTAPPNCAGIRPENVHIARPGDTQTIRGRVYLVENLGMHLISVQIQNSHSEPITVRAVTNRPKLGNEEITLALPPKISTGLISRLVMPLSDRH